MKAENKFITIALLVVVIMFSLVSFKGEKPKTETKVVTETKCFVNQNMSIIKVYIESYTKQGYTVKQLISQSVSTSIDEHYHYKGMTNGYGYRDIKGDIILVLEKQTTVTVK